MPAATLGNAGDVGGVAESAGVCAWANRETKAQTSSKRTKRLLIRAELPPKKRRNRRDWAMQQIAA
jgi:hypothetical protein